MPMIDVYATTPICFPSGTDRQLGEELTAAVLRAEGCSSPRSVPPRQHRCLHPPHGPGHCPHRLHQRRSYRTCPGRSLLLPPCPARARSSWSRRSPRSSPGSLATLLRPPAPGCCSPKRLKAGGASVGTAFGKEEFAAAAKAAADRAQGGAVTQITRRPPHHLAR